MKADIVEPDNCPLVMGAYKKPRTGKEIPEDITLMPAEIWFKRRIEDSHFLIGILDGISNPSGGGFAADFVASKIRAGFYRDGVVDIEQYLYSINEQLILEAKEKNYIGAGTTLALAEINPETGFVKIYSAGDSTATLLTPDIKKRENAGINGVKLNLEANKVRVIYNGYLTHLNELKEQRKKLENENTSQVVLRALDSKIKEAEAKTDKAHFELESLKQDGEFILRDIYSGEILNPIDIKPGIISNYFGSSDLKIFTGKAQLKRDNYLILSSDGVGNTFTPLRMADAAAKNESLEELCKFLVEKSPNTDDRSVVVLYYF